jgi:integrase
MAVTKLVRKNRDGKKTTFYLADIYVRGVKVATKTFETRGHAEAWHDDTKAGWSDGRSKAKLQMKREQTFGDALEAYQSDAEGLLKQRLASQQSMMARMDHFAKSPLVTVVMSDFTAASVDAWLDWLLEQPTAKNPGRKSFRIELKYLSTILNWYRNEQDPSFVVPIVRKHLRRAKFKHVAPRRKDYFIREDDILPWTDWLKHHRKDQAYFRLAKFMVLTGTRLGEACGICWDQVNLERRESYISRSLCWDHWTKKPYLVDTVKSDDSHRLVHLPDALIPMLKAMKLESGGQGPLFRNKKGELLKDQSVRSAFNAGFKALGLPWTATHICRHTWGTLGLKANNDNISKIQVGLGHSDRRVSEIYAKAQAQADRSTVENTAKLTGFE